MQRVTGHCNYFEFTHSSLSQDFCKTAHYKGSGNGSLLAGFRGRALLFSGFKIFMKNLFTHSSLSHRLRRLFLFRRMSSLSAEKAHTSFCRYICSIGLMLSKVHDNFPSSLRKQCKLVQQSTTLPV